MEIEHLRLIQILIADPSISRAAERLGITQSGLSKRLHSIEAEVGYDLFERKGPHGLRPLPQAIEFAQLSERILTSWESGVKRIMRAASEPEHFVLVGPQLFLREVVLPWWIRQATNFPGVQLEIKVSQLSQVSLDTIHAGADAGILEHKNELPDFVCRPIYTEEWGVVRHPQSDGIDWNDLTWGTNEPASNLVDIWLVKRQVIRPPQYHFYWQDLTSIGIWVSQQPRGASVLPRHSVAWLERQGKVKFDPIAPEAKTQLFLAYRTDNPHKRLLKALLNIESEDRAQQESRPPNQISKPGLAPGLVARSGDLPKTAEKSSS